MLTLLTILVVVPYALWKLEIVASQDEAKLQIKDLQNFYTSDDTFGTPQKFMIAAAITSYDGSSEDETDLSIGQIRLYIKTWGRPEDGGKV